MHDDLQFESRKKPKKSLFKKIILILSIIIFLALAGAGFFVYKTGSVFNKISDGNHSILQNLLAFLPLEKDSFASKLMSPDSPLKDGTGRINIVLLGMRGADDPNGGLLADTIMIASIIPKENKIALISIPRDLYVKVPHSNLMHKINFVHAYGQTQRSKGLDYMKEILKEVTGLDTHYAINVNFEAFKETIDLLDGIIVHVPKAISETEQWQGRPFYMPAGDQKMDGETALTYARARYSTSDFDRSKRQQEVLIAIRNKAIGTGMLFNPLKINSFMDIIGTNVKTDLNAWEIKELIDIAKDLDFSGAKKRVFDTSESGLLEAKTNEIGEYILIPRGGTYEEMRNVCQDIFE